VIDALDTNTLTITPVMQDIDQL